MCARSFVLTQVYVCVMMRFMLKTVGIGEKTWRAAKLWALREGVSLARTLELAVEGLEAGVGSVARVEKPAEDPAVDAGAGVTEDVPLTLAMRKAYVLAQCGGTLVVAADLVAKPETDPVHEAETLAKVRDLVLAGIAAIEAQPNMAEDEFQDDAGLDF